MTAAQTLTDDLLDFVDSLRADGYNIGAAQYIHVQNLILLLAARGALPDDPARLRTLIAPIVCDSPERQADLERCFARWCAQRSVRFDDAGAGQATTRHDSLRDDLRRAGRQAAWVRWAVAIVAVAALLVVVVLVNRPVTETPIIETPIDSTAPIRQVQPPLPITGPAAEGLDVSGAVWLAGAVVLALLVQQLLQYLTARRFLTSRLTTDEPDVARLLVGGEQTQVFDRRRMHRTAQNFRLHRRLGPAYVDMEASVLRTVTNPGPFQRVETQRLVVPEYLVLVDRASYRDHQARFQDDQIDWLIAQGVFLHRYYFDSDPRVCHPDERYAPKNARPVTIGELESRYPYRRLLIFSDGSGLVSPFSGRLESWADQLSAWPLRALMTPESPANWGEREERIERSGMLVFPATEAGLDRLVENPGVAEPWRERVDETDRPLPPSLATRTGRWMDDSRPEAGVVEELICDLRWYMGGPDGLRWVSACAVYPELHWPLTLRLGRALSDEEGQPLLTEERLRLLHRLVWFRHGRMPAWLRSRLIRDLTPDQRREIQRVVDALLESALHEPGDEDVLEVALDNPVPALSRRIFSMLRRRSPRNSQLRERVFATFMRDRLAIPLPPVVQQFLSALGPTGGVLDATVRRLRNATRLLIAAAAATWALLFAVDAVGSQSWAHIVVAGLLYSIGISLVILGEVVRHNRVRAAAAFFIAVAMFTAIAEGISPGDEPTWRRAAELALAGTGFLVLLPVWHQWRDVQASTITLGTLRIGRRLIALSLFAAAFPFVSILLLAVSSSLAMVVGGLAMVHLLPLSAALIVLGRATRTRGLAPIGALAPIVSIAATIFVAGIAMIVAEEFANGAMALGASGAFLGWVALRSARWYRRAKPALRRMEEAGVDVGERAEIVYSLRRAARVLLAIGLIPWLTCVAANTPEMGLYSLIAIHSVSTMLLLIGFASASLPLAVYGGMTSVAAALTIVIGNGGQFSWSIDPALLRTGSLGFMLTVGGALWYRAWRHWPATDPDALATRVRRVARLAVLALAISLLGYAAGTLTFMASLQWTTFGEEGWIVGGMYSGAFAPAVAIALVALGRTGRSKMAVRWGWLGLGTVVVQVLVWIWALALEENAGLLILGLGAAGAAAVGGIAARAFVKAARTEAPQRAISRPRRRAAALMRVSAAAHLVFLVAVALVQTAEWFGALDTESTLAIAAGLALFTGAVGIPVSIAQLSYGLRARFTLAWFHACLSLAAPLVHAADFVAVARIIEEGATAASVASVALGFALILAVIWTGFRWYAAGVAGTDEQPARPLEPAEVPRPRFRTALPVAAVLAAAGAAAISLLLGVLQ